MNAATDMTKEAHAAWISDWVANELGLAGEEIDGDRSLLEYSLSSVSATILVGDLEDRLGLELPPTLVWDHPTVNGLAEHLAGLNAGAAAPAAAAAAAPAEDDAALLARMDELSDEEVAALLARLENK